MPYTNFKIDDNNNCQLKVVEGRRNEYFVQYSRAKELFEPS
jgi:hypothetical protein